MASLRMPSRIGKYACRPLESICCSMTVWLPNSGVPEGSNQPPPIPWSEFPVSHRQYVFEIKIDQVGINGYHAQTPEHRRPLGAKGS